MTRLPTKVDHVRAARDFLPDVLVRVELVTRFGRHSRVFTVSPTRMAPLVGLFLAK
jgi:hypothetical protein